MENIKPTIIKGWDIPKEEYIRAHEREGLVKLLVDLSNICNLSCPGCFTKRVKGGHTQKSKKRLSNEIPYKHQFELLEEASKLGVKTIDIVGAGEPTLDNRFEEFVDKINDLGMYAVVFTHGATDYFENPDKWKDKDISFFVKLWSQNSALQNLYVAGSIPDYSLRRDRTLSRLISLGLTEGKEIKIDGIEYKSTRIGADILVMRSNYAEIPQIHRYCREQKIMPIIKTYIPEGPTRFNQERNIDLITLEDLFELKKDEITSEEFLRLRKKLIELDKKEYDIREMKTFYPQACKCTQSMASLYVTVTGEIRSCVGTQYSYGIYEPRKNMLEKAIRNRKEKVGFGCPPRLEEIQRRGLVIPKSLSMLYSEGMTRG